MKQKMVPIGLLSLLLGIAFDVLFYGHQPGISVFLFSGCILAATFYLIEKYRAKITLQTVGVSIAVLFFSAMLCMRAGGFLSFFNCVTTIYLLLLIAKLNVFPHHKLKNYALVQYVNHVIELPVKFIQESGQFVKKFISDPGQPTSNKVGALPIIRGLLLSLPFLIAFLLLFSSADLVFKQYIGSLFDFSFGPELLFRLGEVLFVSALFIGAFSLMFLKHHENKETLAATKRTTLGYVEASIVLGSTTFIFLIFVLIQVTYLFGGNTNITNAGFTYADYARKGFFELIVVAVLSLALILVLNRTTIRRTLTQRVVFMWLSGLLIFEVMVVMLSALKRLSLYEQTYGFTELRLYSHIFIFWLAAVFILLFVRLMQERQNNQFAFHVFITALITFAFVNLLNPEALIARQNINRFKTTGKIDIYYLTTLSDDATPVISQLLQDPDENLKKSVARDLYARWQRSETRSDDWQSYNVSHERSRKILKDNLRLLEANQGYIGTPSEFNNN